jgi:hypothetical protein
MTLGLNFMMGAAGDWGYRVEKFVESPGLYYVDKGTVNLYNTMWKRIVYFNLKEEDQEIDSLDPYNDHVTDCSTQWK